MPRNKEFNEEEVLDKAMLLFWEKGYNDTSIKDLIDALGISNASIYNAFGGKRQLFDLALKHYQSTKMSGIANFFNSQDDVRTGLRVVFEKIVSEDEADKNCKGCFIVNTTTEMIPADSKIQSLMASHRKQIEGHFYDFLHKGVDTGQISKKKDNNMSVLSFIM